jgi:Periplasmic binding protein
MTAYGDANRPWPRISGIRRYGPVILVVVGLVVAGVVATLEARSGTQPLSGVATGAHASVPPTYGTAEREGRTAGYRWPAGCDRATGRLRMPIATAPPCVPQHSGSNGGSTSPGVSSTSITVVYYQAQPGGLTTVINGATGSPAANLATARAYVQILNKTTELYGRHVNLVPYQASGSADDAIAAQADAVRVAQQLHAFASIGGPTQTSAYEDELARLHVLCIGCAISATYAAYEQNAPYLWGTAPTVNTLLNSTVEYIISQLNGKPAQWAGNPEWHHRIRSFAVVNSTQSPPAAGVTALSTQLQARLKKAHVHFALQSSLTYELDLTTLPDQAATIAAKLKASGATTVVFAGDPIMPIYLTRACARLDYYPEWVITGTVYTDTTTLARYYDQPEWAHAFGISSLPVPTPQAATNAFTLYRWWYGSETSPPSPKVAQLILPPLTLLFDGVELAGPHLTPASFTQGIFSAPPSGGGPTDPLTAYGHKGAAPLPSYTSPADYTFVWYDATARGPDEEGTMGTGLIEFVQGGRRYRDGVVPSAPVPMFRAAGAVSSDPGNPAHLSQVPPWPGSPAVE